MNLVSALRSQKSSLTWLAAILLAASVGLGCLAAAGVYLFSSVGNALGYINGQRLFAQPEALVSTAIGEAREFSVTVTNLGKRPVRILGTRSSCSCVATLGLPVSLPPNDRRTVWVKFRPNRKQTGRFTQTLRLFTDEADQRHLDVLLHFHVAGVSKGLKNAAPRPRGGTDAVRSEV